MNDHEILSQLQEASGKLEYLLSLHSNYATSTATATSTNNNRRTILRKYIKDISESISEVSAKIIEAYDVIEKCETADNSEIEYTELYKKLILESKKEKQFIDDFGLSIMLWHLLM